MTAPAVGDFAHFAPEFGTRFWVTIDTEEDFDWNQPFSRTGFRLDSVPALADCQDYFAGAGISPLYLVDWPIVQDERACAILGGALHAGQCEIGAQLHPWVNPPFDEPVNARNSYTANLPLALQRAKLMALRDAITDSFGVAPTSYRAGRYGIGPHSAGILADLGFRCDTSVRSGFDYRMGHGPDFRRAPLHPWWVGHGDQAILEVPVTTVFDGLLRKMGQGLYHHVAKPNSLSGSALARLGLIERIALSPEGIPAERACMGVDLAMDLGLPLLNFSFHSPSLQPGNTPYVRDAADLATFYRWWDAVINHLAKRGIQPTTVAGLLNAATDRRANV